MARDMTQGSLVKSLVQFSLPLVLSGLLQQLYNWADAFIVGNTEGELQLAAIGATSYISGLVIVIITGFTVGISILSAHLYGSGEHGEISKVLSSFTLVLGSVFLLVAALGVLFSGRVLQFLRTPDEIYGVACGYLQIIFVGIPFLLVYNTYAAVLRGMGDSQTSFLAIVVSAVTNILLDILFVVILRYGAVGAAVATVMSQAMMAVFVVRYCARKYPVMTFRVGRAWVDKGVLRRGFRLSLPTAVQSSVHSVGNLALQNFMNGFGTQTVAAITTCYRVDTIILLPVINLGSAIATVVAQNTGAGNPQRAKRGLGVGVVMIAVVSVVLSFIVVPAGGALIAIFGISQEAVLIGKSFFSVIALFYLPFGIATAIKGFLEGVGDVLFSGIASLVALAIRIALSYNLAAQYGSSIIAYAEALSWIALLLLCLLRFLWLSRGKGRRKAEG